MSKAIFSLFCIAALFNSGLVSGYELDKAKLTELCNKAADKAGDGVNALGTYVQGLTKQGQEQLNKYFQAEEGSTEDKILDFAGDLLGKLAGAGAKMGDAEVNKLCGKVGLETDPNNQQTNNNGGANNNQNKNQNQDQSQNQQQTQTNNQPETDGENTNGGNTVQISTLGMFFLALAIFNH